MTNLYEMLDASQVIHKEKPLDTRLIIEFQKKLQKAGYPALPPAFLSFLKVYDGVLMTDSAVLGIEPSKSELNLFEFNTAPHPKINKKFKLFGEQLEQNQENGYTNFFISQAQTQYDRILEIFAEVNPNVRLTPIITSISNGFIDNDLQLCCYTDHEIFERYHAHKRQKKIISSESLTIQDLK